MYEYFFTLALFSAVISVPFLLSELIFMSNQFVRGFSDFHIISHFGMFLRLLLNDN